VNLLCRVLIRVLRVVSVAIFTEFCCVGGGDRQVPGAAALRATFGPGVGAQLALHRVHGRPAHHPGHQGRVAEEETPHRPP
jgi:hypothetical protein